MLVLNIIDSFPLIYHEDTKSLSYKDNCCTLNDFITAMEKPLDRVIIDNTNLLLKKRETYFSVGCLNISMIDYIKYIKKIKKFKK